LVLHTYLEYNTVVRLCHFFGCGRKVNFVQIFLFNPNFLFFCSGGKWFLVLHMYLVYNTVVRLCQFCCCGGKVNFVQIPYSPDRFSKISRTFFVKKMISYKTYIRGDQLFLALYGSTTIQSQLFLKNIENFFCKKNDLI
jgi:hypothetical protein